MISPVSKLCSNTRPGPNGCMEWTKALTNGYGKTTHKGKMWYTHRLMAQLCIGQVEGMDVCHICDNPKCCNPEHLFIGTEKDNMADARAKGRTLQGIKHYFHKITDDDVREIRRVYAEGVAQKVLAKRFGINQSEISRAVNFKGWNHVK